MIGVLQVLEESIEAHAVEAHAVDQSTSLCDTEESWFRVSWLGKGSHRTEFEETETHVRQSVCRVGLLVESRSEADRVVEL